MQISPNQNIGLYSEIWSENQVVHTKSKYTSSIAVIIGVTYGLQEDCNWHG